MDGKWVVLAAASLAFFFVTGTTFTSLAVVLFTMCADLHWSLTEAGLSFSLLGLACGLSSPLPAIAIRWIGARWTVSGGALVLAAGFLIASDSYGIGAFFVAVCLMGTGFSLLAPVPGMFLLPRWFPETSQRMIGFYFMGGSAGGVLGPVLVNASVAWSGSWRLHWALMAGAATLLAVLCAVFVRDRSERAVTAEAAGHPVVGSATGWTTRAAMLTPPFLAIAFAMLVVQTGLTVVNSSLVAHMSRIGAGASAGALATGLLALAGTLAKGVTGAVAERIHPRTMLLASLLLGGGSFLLFGVAHAPAPVFLAAALFGISWGVAWLSAHLLLLRRFGRVVAPDLVALATTITTVAVIGPVAAGRIADRTGSFSPIFLIVAGLFLLALLSTLLTRREPAAHRSRLPDDAVPTAR